MYDFPSYRSHKIVRAAQVSAIDNDWIVVHSPDKQQTWSVKHDPELTARYMPSVDDYLVQYEGGYLSISPKSAFEGGYSPL
jgi:uncharacterized protein YrrD